MSPALKSES